MRSPDPKDRFSSRVDAYIRYRPGYPHEIIEYLREGFGLREDSVVADVGSGTGIFTELLLSNGNTVYAVEPNDAMRAAAERQLGGNPRFVSIAAPAEKTALPAASVDLLTAAHSFHWFDPQPTRREFARVLKPGRPVVLIWNHRRTDTTPFLAEYERFLLRHATDYTKINHANVEAERLEAFYSPSSYTTKSFTNEQVMDFDGLRGFVLSSSYLPGPSDPGHGEMMDDLARLFERHRRNGAVRFEYSTNVYCGNLG